MKQSLMLNTFIVALTLLSISPVCLTYSCRNEKDEKVDYLLALRVYGNKGDRKYQIMDSKRPSWRVVKESDLFERLLAPIEPAYSRIMAWNDNPPGSSRGSSSFAHSKGFIAVSKLTDEGIVVSHSIPDWPRVSPAGFDRVTPPGSRYSQHFLCISVGKGATDKSHNIWNQLKYSKINVYYDSFGYSKIDIFRRFPDGQNSMELEKFTIITKNKNNRKDAYEGVLQTYWDRVVGKTEGFFVQSWGRPYIKSDCRGAEKMINIKEVFLGG